MGVMAITWKDVYDYIRCPKILAFRTAGLKTRAVSRRKLPNIAPHIAGKIGEDVVEVLLPPLTSQDVDLHKAERALNIIEESAQEKGATTSLPEDLAREMARDLLGKHPDLKRELLKRLENLRISIDDSLIKSIFNQTIAGIQISALILREKYGELELLGRAEAKAPVLPSWLEPDFIFKPKDTENMIIVEVKNKANLTSQDRIQASFYASLGLLGGIAVKEHITPEGPSPVPKSFLKPPSSCILLNVRLGIVEEVPAEVNVISLLQGVWEAKQLGLMGKQPDVEKRDYCRRCQWKRFCDHFTSSGPPTATLDEIAKPIPLIIAKALLERGINLDTLWWKDYIAKYVGDLIEERRRAFAKELDSALERGLSISDWMEIRDKAYAKLWAEAVNKVSEYLGLSEDEARILSSLTGPLSWDDFKRACEDFKSEIERWKNVMEALGYTIERNPWLNYGFKKYTTLPKMSNKLTNDAWKWWESR